MDIKYKSYVYIFPLADKKFFKIGKARNPIERLSQLMFDYDIDVKNSLLIECLCQEESFRIENIMHIIYENDRVSINGSEGTEFFEFSCFDAAINMLKEIAKHKGLRKKNIYKNEDIRVISDGNDRKTKSILSTTGLAIKKKRLTLDMSQKELAETCNLSRKTIITIEDSGSASFENIVKVMIALGIEDLFQMPHEKIIDRKRASKNNYQIID